MYWTSEEDAGREPSSKESFETLTPVSHGEAQDVSESPGEDLRRGQESDGPAESSQGKVAAASGVSFMTTARRPGWFWRVGALVLAGAVAGGGAVVLLSPSLRAAAAGLPEITPVAVPSSVQASNSPAVSVYEKLAPSVVLVTNQQAAQQGIFGETTDATDWGSGVIFSSNGYIVTNDHVVENASKVTVTLSNGTTYPATIVGQDPSTDLAVIKISPSSPLPAATFANSNDVVPGETAIVIGNPLGPQDEFSVDQGIVSAIRPMLYGLDPSQERVTTMIQTDAAINPGNSGGPIANVEGQVIGIVSIKTVSTGESGVPASGLGFAIPSNVVSKIANELIKYGYYKWAYLGIDFNNVNPNQVTGTETLMISGVQDPGPSYGKLEAGDVITSWNGHPVENYYDLVEDITQSNPGQTVALGIIRAGKPMTVDITLGTEPKNMVLDGGSSTSAAPIVPSPSSSSGCYGFPFGEVCGLFGAE